MGRENQAQAHAPQQGTAQAHDGAGASGQGAAQDPFERGVLFSWPILIVPDDYRGPLPRTNWIYRRVKTQTEATYHQIEAGSGRIRITENSSSGTAFPGFREKILKAIQRLLTVTTGRQLINNLESGGHDVTIQPDPAVRANANSTATTNDALRSGTTPGTGATSTLSIDPNQSNRTQRAFDRDGNPISFPFFINLGHELIHAMHNQRGENDQTNGAPSDPAYDDREEEQTIDGPGISENALRRQFGFRRRFGHGITNPGTDSTSTVSGGFDGG
jgi:hypothetical protein